MRNKLLLLASLGIFLLGFNSASPTAQAAVSVNEIPDCNSKFQANNDFAIWLFQYNLDWCNATNPTPKGGLPTECEMMVTDGYDAMMQTNLNAYMRCLGIEP